jgi:glycerol-3-phosphate cytidylyltransferase-like family protein
MEGEAMRSEKFIALSGGLDPVHAGHARMIGDASKIGRVLVFLNTDAWLKRKKGYVFMPFNERKELIERINGVELVLPAIDDDDTIVKSLEKYKKIIWAFGNGGDRGENNTPESLYCEENDITLLYGLGGNKIASSSELVNKAIASGA